MNLKKLSSAVLSSLLLALPLTSIGYPASVERVEDGSLLIRWENALAPVDVWVEHRADGVARRELLSQHDSDGRHNIKATDERLYFILENADGSKQEVAERVLPLQGGNNFRDLGGYTTRDGHHVKWGVLFRSGTMAGLTSSDYAYLDQLGIRTVCDFRSTEERTNEPTRWQGSHMPIRNERDYALDTASLMKDVAQPGVTPEQAKLVFATFYREVPFVYVDHYRAMFAELLAGHAPLAFNCSAGKDRTGVASALLLSALGVEHEQVVADYLLSNRYYKPAQPKPGAQDSTSRMLASLSPEIIKVLMGVDASYVRAALDAAASRYGSLEAYFENELGIDAAALQKLRDMYTE
jgi:protein-tyrosine phosphatase